MELQRAAGILMHPSSLPFAGGKNAGIGTFGGSAYDFIDWLESAGMKLWQVLPLGPTGYGDSPYQSFSTFALNPLFIDLVNLVERGWAKKKDVRVPDYINRSGSVEYGGVVWWKAGALRTVAKNFLNLITNPEDGENFQTDVKSSFYAFCRDNAFWLDDYAAFMCIKAHFDAKAQQEREQNHSNVSGTWNTYWDKPLARHNKAAVDKWVNAHLEDYLVHKVVQFFAFTQWGELRAYAASKGIKIIGDIPIFVSPDSSDVWANQKFFLLDENGIPTHVAGVPPDYFSATGQLWGNPLYDWDALKKAKYSWWKDRIRATLKLVDYVRIDHFRGFESFWAVPYGSENAINGEWRKGPGKALFDSIRKELGELPLIAEDLGIITDEVRALRDECGFPGMKILQFAFNPNEAWNGALVNAFLPHQFTTTNCVVYTGTHDNDTTQGLLNGMDDQTLSLIASYVSGRNVDVQTAKKLRATGHLRRSLIQLAMSSTAAFAIIPMQDIYGIGAEGRMNTPSTSQANWAWRIDNALLTGAKAKTAAAHLKEQCVLYNR